MFYAADAMQSDTLREPYGTSATGVFVLTPPESKRLIAKAVVAIPEVQYALHNGRIVVAKSTTGAYVAEELLGERLDIYRYASGLITEGKLGAVSAEAKLPALILLQGRRAEADLHGNSVLAEFEAHDVFIKSANAVDWEGNAASLLGSDTAGTLGIGMAVASARGCPFIIPVGLEKLVPSVAEASKMGGQLHTKYYLDRPVGYMPIVNGQVITEIQALRILTGVQATHIASGGFEQSAGAVVVYVHGADEDVRATMALVRDIKAREKERRTRTRVTPNP
jgi:hypothetical protein